jgi:hypothetical protein
MKGAEVMIVRVLTAAARPLGCALVLLLSGALPGAITGAQAGEAPAATHDGQHDFDFELGTWHAHVRRLAHRLTGSHDWDDFDGTVVTKPFMEGRGNLTEMDVTSPTSHTRIQNIAVRLYNPVSRQWSIYGADARTGVFDPPQIGQFDGRHGEFYATDLYQGRAIYIRLAWQSLSPTTTHLEQAFSQDGGRTWEVNWIYDGTRMAEPR